MKKESAQSVIGIGLILNNYGQILIDQRKPDKVMGGMWEFPGGKKEEGESVENTVIREIEEELAIKVQVQEKLIEFDYAYKDKNIHFVVYFCKLVDGKPIPLESIQVKWVHPNDLAEYEFPPANKSIIAKLKDYLISDK